jgi:hypothetical protein
MTISVWTVSQTDMWQIDTFATASDVEAGNEVRRSQENRSQLAVSESDLGAPAGGLNYDWLRGHEATYTEHLSFLQFSAARVGRNCVPY